MRCIAGVRMLALAGLLVAPLALAWGPLGHRTIAGLAERQLSDAARAQVQALLRPDNESTLVDVATWADDLRDTDPGRFRNSNKLHYVDFSSAQCSYVAQRDCRKGECVVAAAERYIRILGDRTRPREERADALRFVVHFIADVHQPLHASPRRDKGGNQVQLRYGRENWNLHAVWDSLLLNSTRLNWTRYADQLSRETWIEPAASAGTLTQVQDWAEESCRVVRDGGIYPEDNKIDEAYLAAQRPVAEERLRAAAARLAATLNRVLR